MRILLFGATGQVGSELRQLWRADELSPITREECDLRDPEAIRRAIRDGHPEVIVNAAAYTAVDRAEIEVDASHAINATAPATMAEEALRLGASLVHYSTDYVFDGTGQAPYSEGDMPNPQCQYGRSKLEGERRIQSSGAKHLIFRTSWVFSTRGTNFVRTMLRLGGERNLLRVVDDQIGAPTSAKAIATATTQILRAGQHKKAGGLYHMTSAGEVSWAGFAEEIFRQSEWETIPTVERIKSVEYPTPAKRPLNSRLSNERFADAFGFRLSDWRDQLSETLRELAKATRATTGE